MVFRSLLNEAIFMLFRRTDKYGYSRYYGNGGPALVVRIILTVLVALAIVLGAATLILQRYMVYTENGGHLELPWKNKKPSTSQVDPLPLVDESAQQGDDEGDKSETTQPDASLPEEKGEGDTSAQNTPVQISANARELKGGLLLEHVSIGDVTNNYASGTLRDAKANGIMLFMKESGGTLNYASGLALAGELNVSASSDKGSKIQSEVTSLQENDYYALAYLNGFDDAKLSGKDDYALKSTDGGTWSDGAGVDWVDPANEDAQKYLADIVSDMADMGFDEVVLYCASFPYGKNADKVDTDADREAVITAFYQQLATVSEEKDITISLVADPDVILGEESTSGQTLDNLKLLGGRVWVMAEEADDPDALSEALKSAGFQENALGLISDSLKLDSTYPWLNLD